MSSHALTSRFPTNSRRTKEIFDIIIDFPESNGALQDLKVRGILSICVRNANLMVVGMSAPCRSARQSGSHLAQSVNQTFELESGYH